LKVHFLGVAEAPVHEMMPIFNKLKESDVKDYLR
jgi:hypothetical protein